jgi:hypothetical protein
MAMATDRGTTPEQALRATLAQAERGVDELQARAEAWWVKQTLRTQIGVALAALVSVVLVVNLFLGALSRPASTSVQVAASAAPAGQTALSLEFTANDAGKSWTLNRAWQGSSAYQTAPITVGDHWRVDWLFTPTQPGATLQVLIYSPGGVLLQVAANTHLSGADTSFWTGAGTYYLKVNSIGGDWKLDVQDLH